MFMSEVAPERGRAIAVAEGVLRIVAPNESPMTYHGTNSFVVSAASGTTVIDPGPDDAAHLDSVISAAGGKVDHILLTHDHYDHASGVASLAERTGADICAAAPGDRHGYRVTIPLSSGVAIGGLTAIATPGHTPDHLCFGFGDVVFTGDHLMGWAPTAVLAPEGNMRDYRASVARIAAIRCRLYLPGHGPPVRASRRFTDALIARMDARERAIRDRIAERPSDISTIADAMHGGLGSDTRRVALRSIEALLIKLEGEGRAIRDGSTWRALQ